MKQSKKNNMKQFNRFKEGKRQKPSYREFSEMSLSEPFYVSEARPEGHLMKFYFQLRSDGAVVCRHKIDQFYVDNRYVFKFNSKYLGYFGKRFRLSKERTKDGLRIMIQELHPMNRSEQYPSDPRVFLNELDVKMIRMARDSLKKRQSASAGAKDK